MKKFKTKNKSKYNYKIIIILILLLLIFISLSFIKLNNSYSKLISFLTKNIANQNIEVFSLTKNLDYLINTYTFQNEENVYQEKNNTIYLYNTHNLEKYNDGTTILDATELLKNNLNKLGIKVIKEDNKTSELLYTGLSYYNISRMYLEKAMESNNDIKYYIDIHRDSVKNTTHIIDGKRYAKIMFVLGLDNKNYLKNKKIIEKMNNYLNEYYPGLSKGIYEKYGDTVDGNYNQDLGNNVILIEIGGIENNYEEVNNSTEIISLMIYHMLGD